MFRILTTAAILVSLPIVASAQTTWLVPADVPTISDAVLAASDGDTILVSAGTYSENIRMWGKAIRLVAPDGADVTTIDGSTQTLGAELGSVINCVDFESANTLIRGFTITGGVGSAIAQSAFYYGGGALCFGSSPTFSQCRFINNTGADSGGGVALIESPGCHLTSCTFAGNTASGSGGGAYVLGSEAVFKDCAFDSNSALASGGGVHALSWGAVPSDLSFVRCEFTDNSATLSGGGCYLDIARAFFVGCRFTGNATAGSGGGVAFVDGSYSLKSCWLEENTADVGGAISVDRYLLLESTVFWRNEAFGAGGAIHAAMQSDVQVDPVVAERCTFYENIAAGAGNTVHHASGGNTVLHNSIVWASGGAPFSGGVSLVLASYCDLHQWTPGVGNISADPGFVDVPSGDFTLGAGSPCINAGDPLSPLDPDGTVADIGAVPSLVSFVRGDINADGAFDISDAVSTLFVLFVAGTSTPVCMDAGDTNDDGGLDVSDAVYALAALFVIGSPPIPAPHVACGTDPTPDGLECAEYPCP